MNSIKKIFYAVFALILVSTPLTALGAAPVSSGYNADNTAKVALGLSNEPIFVIITVFMNWLLGIIGVLAVVAFVIAGILYLTSAGDEDQAEKAKEVIKYAIIGLVVALLGLIIVNAITGLTGAAGGTRY